VGPGQRDRQRPSNLRRAQFHRWVGPAYLLSRGRPSALHYPDGQTRGRNRGSAASPSRCSGRPETGDDSKDTRPHLCERSLICGIRSESPRWYAGLREKLDAPYSPLLELPAFLFPLFGRPTWRDRLEIPNRPHFGSSRARRTGPKDASSTLHATEKTHDPTAPAIFQTVSIRRCGRFADTGRTLAADFRSSSGIEVSDVQTNAKNARARERGGIG
jgi:hypothetical protein